MELTDGEGSAVVVTDNDSTVVILPEGTAILGDGDGNIVSTDVEVESKGKIIITDGDENAIVLDAKGNILGVTVDGNLIYKDDVGNNYLVDAEGKVITISIVAAVME